MIYRTSAIKVLFVSLCMSVAAMTLMPSNEAHAQACAKPNLLIVLDKSGSMGSGSSSNWGIATTAIRTITNQYNGKLTFGLEVFDSSARIAYGINTCFSAGASCVSRLQSSLAGFRAGGGTNLQRAITTAQSHINSLSATLKSRKTSLMFLTDGQAGCANSQVQSLFNSLKVKTFVIGFGAGVSASCLNSMAIAGQTALAGSRKYYQANNQSDLNNAMKAIANAASQEVCNNQDDDCDGTVDEGLNRACTGPCGKGTETCSKGQWINCTTASQPKPETCNNADDDCDGQTDEGLTRDCTSACGKGKETCAAGKWVKCSAPAAKKETCNNLDDDCDGTTDEDLKRKCSTKCGDGNETCVAGKWDFCDAQKVKPETCNNLDDDCDGTIDNMDKRDCSTKCGPGKEECVAGKWENCSGPKAEAEVCDGKDNNCDGKVDEDISRECKSKCGTGKEYCNNGIWEKCDARLPTKEVCNNLDDDCDGKVDNVANDDPKCPVCQKGVCLRNCTQECPRGFECKEGACVEDPCRRARCGNTETCKDGKCIDVCANVKCKTDETCVAGQCIKKTNKDCTTLGCPNGQKCIEKKCVSDPCATVKCEGREFCREGKCVGSCANITCGNGSKCKDGKCEEDPDPCNAVNCDKKQICKDGKCIDPKDHPCAGVKCAKNEYCDEGKCVDDPCKDIVCPGSNTCFRGQCYGGTNPRPKDPVYPDPNPTADGDTPGDEKVVGTDTSDAGVTNPKTPDSVNKDGGDTNPTDRGSRPPNPVGCPCSIGTGSTSNGIPLSMLLLLFAFIASLRKRR